ncbi:MAG: hypothetical protein COA43_11630 [Robiginitomaculum sp.]|nr:MAG: hypothetical protein COA43_11630 [Robiginitomaculum sp.]
MKFGLPISVALHTLVVTGGMLLWRGNVVPVEDVKIISLDLVTVAALTNIKMTRKEPSKPQEQEFPKEVLPLETEVEKKPPLKPQEIIPEQTVEAREPQELEKPNDVESERMKVESVTPETPRFDLDSFAKMVDKARTDKPDVNTRKILTHEAERANYDHNGAGEATEQTVSIPDYIRAKMEPCWHVDSGQKEYKSLRVEVVLSLSENGEIADIHVQNGAQIIASASSAWRAARENVVTALNKCEPYDGLLAQDYHTWKTIKLNFQPGDI